LKKKITERNDTFETHSEFFGEGLKAQCDESGGRILLGNNTCCCRSGSSVMQFRFQLDSLVYTSTYIYIWPHIQTTPTCAKFHSRAHLPART